MRSQTAVNGPRARLTRAALPTVAAVTVLALLACAEARTQPATDAAPTLNDWVAAHNRGDIDALVGAYAPDALMLSPDGTVQRGHDAVRATFAGTAARESVRLERVAAWSDETVASEIGTWEHFTRDTGATTSAGTYSVVWRRDDGGDWRIVMNGYAVRSNAPGEAAP